MSLLEKTKMKIKKVDSLFLLLIPLIINFLYNLLINKPITVLFNFDLLNLISSTLLFAFLFSVGTLIKKAFSFPLVSTGILFYLSCFFIFDNIFLFITKSVSFNNTFIFVNLLMLSYLIYKKSSLKNIFFTSLIVLINYLFNLIYINHYKQNLTIKGDVEVQWFPMAENIYNFNYFYSLSNPFLDGYGQLISYTHALLLKINLGLDSFMFVRSSVNVLFFLSVLLLWELNLNFKVKSSLILTFSILIINSEWLNYLFVDSLMGEGITSYFFAVSIISVFLSIKNQNKFTYIVFLLFGTMYFTKQFVTFIVLGLIFLFIIYKKTRKYAVFAFIPLFINEVNLLFPLSFSRRDAYASNFDFKDTILDLLTNTNLKPENAYQIFSNFLVDKPVTYLFLLLIGSSFLVYFSHKSLDLETVTYLSIILINIIFILTLYISAWRNMPELDSPIRYVLNLLHLTIIVTFMNLNKIYNKFS